MHFSAKFFSPVKDRVVTNDRWGGTQCQHGGYFTCTDKYLPGTLQKHKWENCDTLDTKSWGFRRTMQASLNYRMGQNSSDTSSINAFGFLPVFFDKSIHISSSISHFEEQYRSFALSYRRVDMDVSIKKYKQTPRRGRVKNGGLF